MNFSTIAVAALLQLAALAAIMAGAWAIQQKSGNSGYIDAVWTFGLGFVGIVSALAPLGGSTLTGRQILVACLMLAWSLRLGLHILQRSAARGDDPRYAQLIGGWGADARRQMFWLVQKQALVTVPLAVTILVAAHNPAPVFRLQDIIAIAIMVAGIAGEGIADRQLRAFSARRARICDSGLWYWSRHPNYFFEWLFWLAMLAVGDRCRRRLHSWLDRTGGAPMHVLAARACLRHTASRAAYARQARGRLPRLSGEDVRLLSEAAASGMRMGQWG